MKSNHRYKAQRAVTRSIPDIFLIPFNSVLLQKNSQLVLKRPNSMVLILILDVLDNLLHVGLAHRKDSIPRLPVKVLHSGIRLLFDPR